MLTQKVFLLFNARLHPPANLTSEPIASHVIPVRRHRPCLRQILRFTRT